MIEVAEIAAKLNARAVSLVSELLPNGRRAGNVWQFSGIPDSGQSWSAWLYLQGPQIGHWEDRGGCAAGEDKGDMLDLVRLRLCGGDKAEAVAWAKRELGIEDRWTPGARQDPAEKARRAEEARQRQLAAEEAHAAEREKKAKNARRLFLTGAPSAGTAAEKYLRGRGLEPNGEGAWPGSLRYHARTFCGPVQRELPAMLAGVFDASGRQIGCHRTFLRRCPLKGWTKADLPKPKMIVGNMWGGFIPINKGASGKSMAQMPDGEPVYVTEGIEDAIVLRMAKPEARIVCAISLGNAGAIVLPARARELVLVCDRDDKPKAQEALERAIAQQQARGLMVRLVMPPEGTKDLNDWLLADRARRRA